jgi:hypothetical protein
METIDKIIISLFVLVVIGYIIQANAWIFSDDPNARYSSYGKQWQGRQQWTQTQQPVQSQAIITANEPILIQPLKQNTTQQVPMTTTTEQVSVQPIQPTIQGVTEQNLFRQNLQKKRNELKYNSVTKEGFENIPIDNEMISNANYAKFQISEPLNLTEAEIEEKNVFNNLFN